MGPQNLPQNWGKDELSEYLDAFRRNQLATFANKKQSMLDLVKIDGMFHRLLNGAINPRPRYPMHFMQRAHSAYRTGVSAIMGGQLYEAQTLLRLCIEHAAYGFYIGADSDRFERWLRRGDSDDNRKAVRKEFHPDKLRAQLRAKAPIMCDQFDQLYNSLIELGAHPNEMGYSLNSSIIIKDDNFHFETVYLQGDGANLDSSMKVVGRVGLWALNIMQIIYRERCELLGIREDLEEVRSRF